MTRISSKRVLRVVTRSPFDGIFSIKKPSRSMLVLTCGRSLS